MKLRSEKVSGPGGEEFCRLQRSQEKAKLVDSFDNDLKKERTPHIVSLSLIFLLLGSE